MGLGVMEQLDKRKFKIYTGSRGLESLHTACEIHYLKETLAQVCLDGKIE